MQEQEERETGQGKSVSDDLEERREAASRWHRELKQEEGYIAPWLNLEWTGEDMEVKRG